MGYGKLSNVIFTVVMAVAMVVLMTRSAEAQVADCAQKLTACVDYLNRTTSPPDSCCNPIKEAVATQLPCLCNLYTTPGFLQSIGVNVADALFLTQACGVPVDISKCNSTAPSPALPPPAVPGTDNNNGAERIAWTGIGSLFMLLASVALY